MLSHAAFWDEAIEGFVLSVYRQQALPPGWEFGSGYVPDPGEWPSFMVHNAREAEWGRGQTAEAVLDRLRASHARMLEFLQTVTDEEITGHPEYFAELGNHYTEHLPELQGLP